MRIGVFICHCGSNIAGTVDCAKVAENARMFPDVVLAQDIMYTCAEPGQAAIEAAIHEHKLDGVVVASCSPRIHEPTFRRTVERAGLNRYMFEMANIREHVSWIGKDKEANTNKATELVQIAVAKLRNDKPLKAKSFDVNKRVLIIGAGVAGIQAALDCAEGGIQVVLVEREATIGGKMAKLDKTFPTVDCSACILGPKMVDVAQHPNITLYAKSEVEDISGYVGNFSIKIRKRATYVDWDKCTGCGACTEKCPAKKTPDTFNELVGPTTAINIAFPQAIPKKAVINPEHCRQLTKGKCGVCAKVCPTGAINYEQQDEIITEEVGCIVAATGYDLMDWTVYEEYGGGRYPDVVTSLQYERLLSASGPTEGHIKRPSDGKEPKNIVFIQCVGSRDRSIGRPYCSGFCCMYTAKQAILTKDHIPDSKSFVFYMDIRANGKIYDEFTRRAMEEYGTEYIRGRVSKIYPDGEGHLIVRGVDTLLGEGVEIKADLVVLAVGVEAAKGSPKLAEKLRISYDSYGFFLESHVKLKPVETNTAGVYLAGVCQGVKDIPASVAQGSAAAAKVLGLFSKDKLENDPQIASVDMKRCVDCGKCIRCCPFGAIKEVEFRGKMYAQVIETVCQGCGLCTSTCPQGAIQLSHATDNQILAEVNTLCQC
ncbi:MAG TPA: CoB--CoM heterodisulfide reductase iron-sulfur subunit A family protein [Candidatus Desulfovibrio gallistercoris]|uniref:CoB--CoM heterodisulfide reductase iron-sulfur subunit A family protein n=1 Tax=uncultured Desulfovibrio sp. TaxID=167968 RepID=UPI001F935BBC|nr:CoB--CoM heterodisulfide reductase iron-sulfur subunit A family protein [uncultured Desulfovibrio sp.]HJA75680.1 CoB--CoM heterodisulfide reductase iron-sulfur subunit A family protein [Candidatus Desulfovibrio gallistercoris]